jgi:hypothetical protein
MRVLVENIKLEGEKMDSGFALSPLHNSLHCFTLSDKAISTVNMKSIHITLEEQRSSPFFEFRTVVIYSVIKCKSVKKNN